jgi:hypothetical protein
MWKGDYLKKRIFVRRNATAGSSGGCAGRKMEPTQRDKYVNTWEHSAASAASL